MIDCNCPHCSVLLRKVEAETGRTIRCTSCGQPFHFDEAGKLLTGEGPLKPTAATPETRDDHTHTSTVHDENVPAPKAHYGYLHIAGFLLMAASVAGSAVVTAVEFFPWFYAPSGHLERCWIPAVAVGVPLLGVLGFLVTLRVAWLDGQVYRLAAVLDARVTRTPTLSGSNLPFILPWMVSGAVAVIVPLTLLIMEGQRSADLEIALPIGVLLFAMGLALGEVRRFFVRMSWAEDHVTKSLPRQEAPVATVIRMGLELLTPYSMLAAALLTGVLFAAALWQAVREDERIRICLFSALTFATIGGAYSLYRISKALVAVVAKSERLARLLNLNRTGTPFMHQHAPFFFSLAMAFSLWGWGPLLKGFWALLTPQVPQGWIPELPVLAQTTGLLLAAAMWSTAVWLGGLLLLIHRATRSLLGIVESSVPPREAWQGPAFLPRTVASWSATALLIVSLANMLAFAAFLLWGSKILTNQPILATSILTLIIILLFTVAGRTDNRPGCMGFVYFLLTILVFWGAIPTAPEFMLPIAGSLVGVGIALTAHDVERVAERIEATSR